MKTHRFFLTPHGWVVLIVLAFISACAYFASWDELYRDSIGRPIAEKLELWGQPDKIWVREDGKAVYEYHLKKIDPTCVHYWVVNDKKIIVDLYHEGHCRPVG